VRYLGITGHYRPEALIEAIHRHPIDTILTAANAADPHHSSFSEQTDPAKAFIITAYGHHDGRLHCRPCHI
jgi:hypothetical protein